MEQRKLKKLLSEMSLREKIGQMIQLTGIYFDDDAVLTGEVGEDQPPQWVTQYAGSVLGMIGAEKLRGIQKKYRSASCIYSLLFMADVLHGLQDHSSRFLWDRLVRFHRNWLERWRDMPQQSLLLRGSGLRFLQ